MLSSLGANILLYMCWNITVDVGFHTKLGTETNMEVHITRGFDEFACYLLEARLLELHICTLDEHFHVGHLSRFVSRH